MRAGVRPGLQIIVIPFVHIGKYWYLLLVDSLRPSNLITQTNPSKQLPATISATLEFAPRCAG